MHRRKKQEILKNDANSKILSLLANILTISVDSHQVLKILAPLVNIPTRNAKGNQCLLISDSRYI
jgi:hypothetical protein